MMTLGQFYLQAAKQKQNVSQLDVDACTSEQLGLHLEGVCLCCTNNETLVTPIEEVVEYGEDYNRVDITGYMHEIFCDACMDHLPLEVLEKYHAKKKQYRLESLEDYDGDELPF